MDNKSQIVPTTFTDLEGIYHLFDQSVIYQEQHGYPAWRNYDKDAIVRDIENGNQYKVMQEDRIAMVFSVAYADAVIWRHRDKQDAVYLHRIVVNPACKGKRLFGNVLDWSIVHARSKGRKAVRMDTWAANPRIIEYYQGFGFGIVEHYTTPDTIDLPVHNRNLGSHCWNIEWSRYDLPCTERRCTGRALSARTPFRGGDRDAGGID